MNPNAAPPKVILRHCDSYDPAKIEQIVREGLAELGLTPHGKTLVKPNLVASGKNFPIAYTRPEVAEGVLRALKAVGGDKIEELALGERCGITIPTRHAFREAGYPEVIERLPDTKVYFFDEVSQVEIPLTHPGRLRDYLYTPEPVAKADFFVNMPKFKSHPWTTVTFSMKNYIGIQDDRHRLIDHDHRLNEKVADLQYIIQPQFIVIDAITAGEGRMLTPRPRQLNMIIMGNNQVAFDAVCSTIIGVEPRSVEHIQLAEDRGFGTTDLSKIAITGDVTLAEAITRAKGFQVGLVRVEKYFEGTKITAYAGPPPDKELTDYCWGGCPGALEESIEILRLFDAKCDEKMPKMHIVFGAYEGKIDAKPGEKVVFIGDCATYHGKIGGELVQIKSTYKERDTKDPHHATAQDIYAKMVGVMTRMAATRNEQVIRLEGCPVSVAEQVLTLVNLAGTTNPYLIPSEIIRYNRGYFGWRTRQIWNRIAGREYQVRGPTQRGEAAPVVKTPATTTTP